MEEDKGEHQHVNGRERDRQTDPEGQREIVKDGKSQRERHRVRVRDGEGEKERHIGKRRRGC
jgi:hypothetical protein